VPKIIIKITLIHVLAFFIFGAILSQPLNAQDIKTFENGLRVMIKEDHRNPIVVFSAFMDIGSAYEGEYMGSGISHLIEHMLFKGTKKYPPGAIENILHIYGGEIQGFTSYDYTGYRITILKEHKDVALDVLKEMLTSPMFNAKELKKEMQVIEREMEMNRDEPGRRLSRLTFSSAYITHPYRVPIVGYKENFARLERNDLVRFFGSNYTPERTIIAVVGDIDKEAMFNDIEELFGKIPRGGNVSLALPREPDQIAVRYTEEKLDIDGAYLNIAFHSTGLLDKDLYALDILSFILGQGESSILNENIRMEKETVLSISSYNYTPRDPGLFIISSVLKEENVKKAIDEIMGTLDAVKEKGVTSEELAKAKNNFIAGYIYQKETIQSRANDMALGELLAGDPGFFELYIKRIESITLDDIRRAAKKYLTRDNMTVVVLSKSGNTLNPASSPLAQEGRRELKKITLENKLPVLVCENPALPILSITLLFKGGVRIETEEQNGISKLTSLMLMDGMDSMRREEIARFYESKGMSVESYSGNNSLGISVKCLKEHAEDALKLVADLCIHSSFPEEELERERNEAGYIIDIQDDRLFNHGHRRLKGLLFKKHPYRFQVAGTHESIDKIEREDILRFRAGILSADNMVLGISGDCDSREMELLAEKYFSKVPLRETSPIVPEKEPAMKEARRLLIDTDKEQSLVLIGFHGIDIYSSERYAIEVMADILSSESGILFKNIREKKGLSYATGAFHVLGLDPGYIALYALTSRENIYKVKDIMFREITAFIKKGGDEKEIQKSKNHLKAMRRIAMQTDSSFIFTSSLDELYGLGYDNYKDYDKNIDAVTRKDIKRAAKEFLTLNRCAVVILKGKE